MDSESVDLIITSPPYNVGIPYKQWDDRMKLSKYEKFTREWLLEAYRVMKVGGRIVINIPYQVKMYSEEGVLFMPGFFWKTMSDVGLRFAAFVDLVDENPHRKNFTAWGSWLSASAPHISNSKECLLIGYKGSWRRQKGKSWFGNDADHKREFMRLVSGSWRCAGKWKRLTPATFRKSIPEACLKLLSFKDDIVVDPFTGSATTGVACLELERDFIGFEICDDYAKIARSRLAETSKALDISGL